MATPGTISVKIQLDGAEEFRSSLNNLNAGIRANGEMVKTLSSSYNASRKSVDSYKSVATALNNNLDMQKQKVVLLTDEIKKSTERWGENSRQTSNLVAQYNKAQGEVDRLTVEIEKNNEALEKSKKSTISAGDGFDKLSEKMKSAGESISKMGKTLSVAVTAPLVVAGKKIIDVGSDYEEAVGKIEATMGSMSQSIISWSSKTLESFGVASVSALQMTGDLGNMATSMGIAQKEAAGMGMRLTELASDLSTFHDKSLDVAQTALVSIFTGETESLKKFGVVMTEANLKQYALDNGFKKNINSMSQAEKVLLRYNFVLDQTASAHGNYARESDNFGASMMTFKEATKELGVVLSTELLPIITPIIQNITSAILEFSKMDTGMKKAVIAIGLFAAALGPLLMVVGSVLKTLAALPAALEAIQLAMVALTGPIGLAVAAVVALIAVFAILYNTNDSFKAWVDSIVDSLRKGLERMINFVSSGVSKLKDWIMKIPTFAKDMGVKVGENISKAVKDMFEWVKNKAKEAWEWLTSLPDKLAEAGKNLILGFWEGIKSKFKDIKNGIKKFFTDLKDSFLDFWKIKSPSRVTMDMGKNIGAGFLKGYQVKIKDFQREFNAGINLGAAQPKQIPTSAVSPTVNNVNIEVNGIQEFSDLMHAINTSRLTDRMNGGGGVRGELYNALAGR